MIRFFSFAILGLVVSVSPSHADTLYSWTDAAGQLHFSNRVDRVPPRAKVVSPPPLGQVGIRRTPRSRPATAPRMRGSGRDRRRSSGRVCPPADAHRVASAIGDRLASRDDLVVLVGGVPVPSATSFNEPRWSSMYAAGGDRPWSELEQGAIAHTAAADRPPLDCYPVRSRSVSTGQCRDFERAIRQIGVAIGRDGTVAQAFEEIADKYEDVARNDYTTVGESAQLQYLYRVGGPASADGAQWVSDEVPAVRLPEWLVEAHVAQTRELGDETADMVEELVIAFEEIDRAAQYAGCW